MRQDQKINLLIDTYIAYVLSLGYDAKIADIKKYAENLKKTTLSEETFKRKLRDRKEELIEIGALKETSRAHTSKNTDSESAIFNSDYCIKLNEFIFNDDEYMKTLYLIVMLLNTTRSNNVQKNIKEIVGAYSYAFKNDLSNINPDLNTAINYIGEMFETFENTQNDEYSPSELKLIHKVFNKDNYKDIFTCVATIKIHPEFGYTPNDSPVQYLKEKNKGSK